MKRLLATLSLACCFFAPLAHSQKAIESWLFKHKTAQITRAIQQGKPITVKWQGLGGPKTTKGILLDISKDSTLLDIKGAEVNIPNDRITDIRGKSKSNVFVRLLAGVLIFIGVYILGLMLVALLATFGRNGGGASAGLVILGVVSLTLGIVLLAIQPKAPQVREPFGQNWTIEPVLHQPKKQTP